MEIIFVILNNGIFYGLISLIYQQSKQILQSYGYPLEIALTHHIICFGLIFVVLQPKHSDKAKVHFLLQAIIE